MFTAMRGRVGTFLSLTALGTFAPLAGFASSAAAAEPDYQHTSAASQHALSGS